MTLHSILGLGGGRVKKKKRTTSAPTNAWTSSLPRTKSSTSKQATTTKHGHQHGEDEDESEGESHQQLTPITTLPFTSSYPPPASSPSSSSSIAGGAAGTAAAELIRIHKQALRAMFDVLPERGIGLSQARIAALLAARDAIPPLSSAGMVRVALAGGPSAAERGVAALVRDGVFRRVILPSSASSSSVGGQEVLILAADLDSLVEKSGVLGEGVKGRFRAWLRENPSAQVLGEGEEELFGEGEIDELVRAGFLTALNEGRRGGEGLYARPAERHVLVSIETVSRAAAGSVDAVGGDGAVHGVGGTGRRRGVDDASGSSRSKGEVERFRVAVPGAGAWLKLVAAAMEYLAELLRRAGNRQRIMAEADLREKWDGAAAGAVAGSAAAVAKRARGEVVAVLPGRTRKWRDLNGLGFDWVLREAVGAGVVEVFETGSVGRGVRLVS
ncbi:serine-threonine protein kinase 19-domain-containing protein [Echria macrotheca]|uniref:Serine-threonine protein kinase 19-domain-containing protein n=1 Tax=Echria macrotheca TaxID=438768 RepID=A0AAJ0BCZ6_9PEZI|nr:serine-threonine protein kinase 19-domain-containing protein [Echria macrotheca]